MNEDYLKFLEDSQIQCLQLLNIGLINGNDLAIGKESIQQSIGLSNYKFDQGITKLNADLSQLSGSNTVYVTVDKDNVTFFQISSKLEKRLRAFYAETSNYFSMFEYLYLNERSETRQQFMTRMFISISHFFTLRNKVANMTQEIFNINVNSSEALKRQVVFNVFYYFFNGIRFPFINLEDVTTLIKNLQTVYRFKLRSTQLEQLRYFCAIQLSRSNNSQAISHVPLHSTSNIKTINLTKDSYKDLISPDIALEDEAAFTYDFLHVTGMIPFDLNVLTPIVRKKIQRLTKTQTTILSDHLHSFDDSFDLIKVANCLNQVNLRLEFPFFTSSTFADPAEVRFFKETYPRLHETVMLLVNKTIKQTAPLAELPTVTQLYYTIFFSVMLTLPINTYSETIYVTVDFSQGDIYTNYIAKTVEQLSLSNLVIEQYVSAHTDLYLSDIFVTNIDLTQVTWKNPPKPIDWQELGDTLVNIQNKKYGADLNESFKAQ